MKKIEITSQGFSNEVLTRSFVEVNGRDTVYCIEGAKKNRELAKILRECEQKIKDLAGN